jgi:hypothetical protein
MRQIRIAKRRTRPASWQLVPLQPDPRDPDIVHAHHLARRGRVPGGRREASGRMRPDQADPGQTAERA